MKGREPWFVALRAKAEAADPDAPFWNRGSASHPNADFIACCTPARVLALIDIAEAAEGLASICGRAGLGAAVAGTPHKRRLERALREAANSQEHRYA